MRAPALLSLCVIACQSGPSRTTGAGAVAPGAAPAAGRARAFRIASADQLLPGPAATGAIADVRLENDRVAFIVSDLPIAFGFAETGGHLVDAAPLGGRDALSQLYLYLDDTFPRQALYDALEITSAEGEEAVVVARGHDSADPRLAIVTEYRLRAGEDTLVLSTTVTNTGADPVRGYEVGDVIAWGRADHFLPGLGFVFRGRLTAPWLAGVGEDVAYGYAAARGQLGGIHGRVWSDTVIETLDLPPGASATVERFLVVGARGDVGSVLETILRRRGEPQVALAGVVREEGGGGPVAGAIVTVLGPDLGPVATARTGEDGRYSVPVAPGAYVVAATAPGRVHVPATTGGVLGDRVVVGERGATVPLTVTRAAFLEVAIAENGAPSPGKITIRGVAPTPTPILGSRHRGAGAENVIVTANGQARAALPPGRYEVFVSRGLEYDLARHEVALAPGATVRVDAALRRVVDTTGYLGGDFHQHALPSPDSAVSLADRVVANLAEGVEIAVATDHNEITDYAPVAAEVGAGGRLRVFSGLEATTEAAGHFNAYPLRRVPHTGRGGAPAVEGRTPREIFGLVRGLGDDLVLQVNHPRSRGSGYFLIFGLDPTAAAAPPGLELGFDAVELVNGKRLDDVPATLRDWFWLLGQGHVVTAMGNSDSHAIVGEECGYPRTYLGVGHDDPARIDEAALSDAIKRRRDVIVTNGPFVTLSAEGGSAIGRTFTRKPRQPLEVELVVQAAPWVDVTRIEVYANGEPYGAPIPVAAARGEVTRYRGVLKLAAPRDAWFVVIVRGEASLDPVVPAGDRAVTPIAITNPIWLKTER